METHKITVLVQTFERPTMLRKCLKQLRINLLKYTNGFCYELIVVDDGSTSSATQELLSTCSADRVIINPDKKLYGPGWMLNRAYESAQGEYIIHVEDDCLLAHPLDEEMLRRMLKAFEFIPDLESLRLRRIKGDNSEAWRLHEYFTKTEELVYKIDAMEFRIFKKYENGGPGYQYTGHPHMQRQTTWFRVGPYPEQLSIWRLENSYGSRFRELGCRAGRFLEGWFSHIGEGKKSTKHLVSAKHED